MRSIAPITLLLGLFITTSYAQSSSNDFDALVESFNNSFESLGDSGLASIESVEAEYDALQAKIDEEYSAFEREISDLWGEKDATVSDRYNWVEYSDDKRSRSIVDFESGEVEIELLLTDEELSDAALVDSKMDEALQRLSTSRGKSVEYESQYIPQEDLSPTPIMNEIFDIRGSNINREAALTEVESVPSNSKKVSNEDLEREVRALRAEAAALNVAEVQVAEAQEAEVTAKEEPKAETAEEVAPKESAVVAVVEKVETAEGDRNVVIVKSNLKVGYLGELAKRYETLVISNAERFNISATLIFAVMETESYFNPTATSHIPAYGLMQIVPKYAGRDAYNYLYGKDIILSKNYLYQADKNIEIGSSYLSLLASRYFKGVTDPNCQELCMIAAYNTGAGNVSRAIAGHTNVYKSIPQINAMNYSELYNHLRDNLPYEETRDYIKKVTTKREKYIAK